MKLAPKPMRIALTPTPFNEAAELARFRGGDPSIGALANFVGYCRSSGAHGPVAWLELEHYPGFTEKIIARLGQTIVDRYDIQDILVIHRVGRVAPGEAIVLVAAKSAHRAEAFAAVEAMMDFLKTDAPFWKREGREDGAHWIEPTEQDRQRRAAHEREQGQ